MTYVNPLVESGEYVRVFAGEVEPGDILAAYGDSEVTAVTPYPGERVALTLGGLDTVSMQRASVLLVKVFSPSAWTFPEKPGRAFGPYRSREEAREAFQRVYGWWPNGFPTREVWQA